MYLCFVPRKGGRRERSKHGTTDRTYVERSRPLFAPYRNCSVHDKCIVELINAHASFVVTGYFIIHPETKCSGRGLYESETLRPGPSGERAKTRALIS